MKNQNEQKQLQTVSSDFGPILRVKNMNFDMDGYAKLSHRMVRIKSEVEDSAFDLPVAISRQATGEAQIMCAGSNYGMTLTENSLTVDEDTGTSNPAGTLDSDGTWFSGLWHVSTATAVLSRPSTGGSSQAWTSRVTGLTSGYRHIVRQNKSRVQLCVTNGNVVKQYNTSYANTTDLTIPSDYEISGMEYSNGNMGIITRLTNDGTNGNDQEAMFYLWNGSNTSASVAIGLGSDAGIMILPYKSSFVVLTRAGELKYFNGAGFTVIAELPFRFANVTYGDARDNNALGNVFGYVNGDKIDLIIGNDISVFSRLDERYLKTFPAGVWCFDPSFGLYHKNCPSNSPMYINTVTSANIDTGTDILTISSGTIPSTGNIARLVATSGIGGLTKNNDYFIIKLSSTTFKLSETREKALAGDAIDITSATSVDNQFMMFEHVDYGTTSFSYPGSIASLGESGNNYAIQSDIIAGARVLDTDSSFIDTVSISVPWFENVGAIETIQFFAGKDSEKNIGNNLNIRFKPLDSISTITVYSRTEEVYGLPLSTLNDRATWSGTNSLYTSRDLSVAEDYINNNGSILMEILAGAGAGSFVEVQKITCENNVCSIELVDDVFGVQSGDVCDFIIENYKKEFVINSEYNNDGFIDAKIDSIASKFAQFIFVLKGSDIVIEQYIYKPTLYL